MQLAGTTSREIIEKSRGGVCLTKAFIDEALDGGERPEGKLGDACLLGELVTGCIAPLFCDSTPGLRGGYCTRVCGDDGECGDGFCSCGAGFCAGTFNPTGFCFASCFGLGTQSTCRPGYLCTEFDLAGDQGACLPE